jgi:hypothetical protein
MLRIMSVLLATVALASCAKLEVLKVKDSPVIDGVRFYRPAPYLLVTAVVDENGQLTNATMAQIIWLPDQREEYQVRATAGIGSVELNPTLTDGWNLTALSARADSKTSENITALAALLTAVRGGGQSLFTKPTEPPKECPEKEECPEKKGPFVNPGLYPLKFEDGTWTIDDLQ